MFGFERRGECGTAPAGTAPAIGPWGGFEYSAQRAHQPWYQDGHPHGDGELTVWVDTDTETPGAIRTHNAVYAGARTKQEGRNLRRISARRPQQQDVERQQIAIPGAAKHRTHLDLLF